MSDIKDPKSYFSYLHDVECNQKYNKTLPYSFHLNMVYLVGEQFKYLIPNRLKKAFPENSFSHITIYDQVVVALYGHDAIEDARVTYNDINEQFGSLAAEIIYLCTENKGKNRDERKSLAWYKELDTNELAVFVKLCDLIANVKFGIATNSSMTKKYKAEYIAKVKPILYCEQYKPMFDYLDDLFKLLDY